ncbi:tRNA dihydrouridine synthase DusB [Nordella sp. HKS 07]|uniref:tRNA dihydrouridine synthase DusB n=1 Tax=Nordella sp. HKS 07 TaxID=2712222 RepID=UPI0013E1355F|nr:tRNA dihydrouridine synthase DusB [Nordella sp. HKS 07]QIG51175.1 tRNA dihydrouridine synthase DusB [Nordella sp. HKS 07]
MSISVGDLRLRNRVLLAPMSGVSDRPFREIADLAEAGLVVTEMVASRELAEARADMVRRTDRPASGSLFAIQLAGREPHWMAEGARIAQDLGADIIDINMGCPARQVTGGYSGSALMRDLDHALTLIEATVAAARVPVTLKMRLGWDERLMNAPELARRAEQAGVKMVTVHGRTRCQFYKGKANWTAIAAVKQSLKSIPLIANGDVASLADIRAILRESGADGVMVGRGSYGRPWWPGVLAHLLDPNAGIPEPDLDREAELVERHHQAILSLYGHEHGNRIARKHLGWIIERKVEQGLLTTEEAAGWRRRLTAETNNVKVADGVRELYARLMDRDRRAA